MKQFNGNRLKQARLYNGLTVEELAKKINISAQAESQYEIGKILPQFDRIIEFAKILNFPVQYFLQDYDFNIQSGSSYFRSLMKTQKKYRTEQKTKVEFLAKLYTILEEYIEFPSLDLPQISIDEEYESPEEAAQALREHWKLGDKPITNLLRLLEAHGIIVTTFDVDTEDIDAFSQFFEKDGKSFFIIAYSSNKQSAARINFDLAHELGHIMLHSWSDDSENMDRETFKRKENEANRFASAFLLPETSFKQDVRFYPTNLDRYIELKKKWRVSIGAMLYRACYLAVITQSQYQYLIRIMNAKNIRKQEPLDNIIEIPYPRMLRDSVEMLITNDVFTKTELINEFYDCGLPMNSDELEKLLVLEKGYFDENDNSEDIIPLSLKFREQT